MHAAMTSTRLRPAQVQFSLLDRRVDNGMLEYCETGGIKLLPFGTVAGGFLTEKYLGVPVEKCARPELCPCTCMPCPLFSGRRRHDAHRAAIRACDTRHTCMSAAACHLS